jgi:nitroreductase
MNGQPWRFVVVEDRAMLRRLGAAATIGPYIAEAPLAVVVVIERTRYAVSDGSRAIQSMMLTAWAEGVGSNGVGFAGMPEVNALLGIPDNLDVLAVVPFGYPVQPGGQGKKRRKPLAMVAHSERFGQPFE